MTQSNSEQTPAAPRGSRFLGRILPVAVRLWLQSQVEQIEGLSFELQGSDREILSGYLPAVSLSARQAVYRGIHVQAVAIAADQIRINLGQVLQGRPLRLLAAFPVRGEIRLSRANLNDSWQSPLLQEGLQDFWASLYARPGFQAELAARYGWTELGQLHHSQVSLRPGQLILSFYPQAPSAEPSIPQIVIATGLTVQSGHLLVLQQPQWLATLTAPAGDPIATLENFQWDLGSQAKFEAFELLADAVYCRGQVQVTP
ncbi:DUF2993 domain-containing protein [Romeria aff. gracilis LEGE 07310]|uniref:DUF2993 domain-containing protein n=1 Tax=Vasconcelosia minhoensis LEGE 07310 TaxID=915328 RepID=A0A8J7AJN3_9CYAN|nr:DUF2993 domain-containing protein [Romeria gracilis]MBE9078823.1 DUF2993 domain-containing protein [Romeria aff. gracilis LEGE 07310]